VVLNYKERFIFSEKIHGGKWLFLSFFGKNISEFKIFCFLILKDFLRTDSKVKSNKKKS
jgi:hypothetical protein